MTLFYDGRSAHILRLEPRHELQYTDRCIGTYMMNDIVNELNAYTYNTGISATLYATHFDLFGFYFILMGVRVISLISGLGKLKSFCFCEVGTYGIESQQTVHFFFLLYQPTGRQ